MCHCVNLYRMSSLQFSLFVKADDFFYCRISSIDIYFVYSLYGKKVFHFHIMYNQ